MRKEHNQKHRNNPMPLYRKATVSDANMLIDMYMTDIDPDLEHAESFASDLITRMETILCLEDDNLCGTVSCAVRGGMNDGVVEITALGVREQYQRRGIATQLINEVIKHSQEVFSSRNYQLRRVFLFMEESNDSARQLYTAAGFKEVASIPDFYPTTGASIFVRQI